MQKPLRPLLHVVGIRIGDRNFRSNRFCALCTRDRSCPPATQRETTHAYENTEAAAGHVNLAVSQYRKWRNQRQRKSDRMAYAFTTSGKTAGPVGSASARV